MKRFLSIVSLLAFALSAGAQVIENDPGFRIGKLANGMTYYLYHNENPVHCADFYIAHNVGALQEEDNQNGLAHFLEHMAFNGTRHYGDKELLNFLAKEGVRFGYNVNAYTSRTETVYNIDNVPLVRESFVDSVLLILHDWSCDISCEQDALDAERGVISEEWRLSDDQRWRMSQKQTGLLYKGGKHPKRTVLGTLDIINGFKREEILDFYHKWYRPDLQAIIVVGDFDVDAMEKKLRQKFSDIQMPANPPRKDSTYLPPHRDEALIENMTDPGVNYQTVKLMYKQPWYTPDQLKDESYIRDNFCRMLVSSIMSDRLRERLRGKSPVRSAVLVTSELKPDYYLSLFTITPKKNFDFLSAFDFALTEVRRMVEFGISEEEFEIAKLNLDTRLHLSGDVQPDDLRNSKYVKICLENFLRGVPCLTPLQFRQMQRRVLSGISYELVNSYPSRMFVESEAIFSNCLNEKEADKAPSEKQMLGKIKEVNERAIEPLFLTYPKMDLSVDAPAGKILRRKSLSKAGVTEMALSNGATVYLRHCDPVDHNVHLSLECKFEGGYNRVRQDNIAASDFSVGYLRRHSGFRGVCKSDFKNYPSLADVNLILSAGPEASDISVSCGEKSMENAFRSLHLQIMEPYFSSQNSLDRFCDDRLKALSKVETPRQRFDIDSRKAAYGPHPWLAEVDSSAVEAVDMPFVEDLFARLFTDVRSMKLYVCTDAPDSLIEDYLCRYVASISCKYPYQLAKVKPMLPTYRGTKEFFRSSEKLTAPVCKISCNFSTRIRKTTQQRIAVNIFDYLMSARYLNLIREERGGAYHAALNTAVGTDPTTPIVASVDFQTRPELREILLSDVKEEMLRMSESGPSGQEMEVAKKYFAKAEAEHRKVFGNSTFRMLEQLVGYVENGIDYGFDYAAALSSVKPEDIKSLAARLCRGNVFVAVYSEE